MSKSPAPESPPMPSRRDVLRRVSALLGAAAFVGGSGLLAALERRDAGVGLPGDFSAAQVDLLDEIAETILPATKTPGAKAAATGAFMALMVTDGYSPAQRAVFMNGLGQVDAAMREAHGCKFMDATGPQRLELLSALDRDQKRVVDAIEASGPGQSSDGSTHVPYFRMMKELALLGFFTSQIGCTQVQRYVETPGRYDPCAPYAPGEPAWAMHA